MKKIIVLLFSTSLPTVYAWDFSLKGDAQRAYTDNVNLTNTNQIADSYSIFSGYAQTKNDAYKFKLRAKLEKYQKQTENDNYSLDLGFQYKHTKHSDYTFAVFKQVYNGIPVVSTDTTSDNSGGRITANFATDFNENTYGYFTPSGTIRNYSKITGRKDTIIGTAAGLEHNITPAFMVNPEFNIQNNNSGDDYYSNLSYGPSILLSYSPNDSWDFYADASYTYTSYANRTITSTVTNKGRSQSSKEYQALTSAEISAVYSFANNFSIQASYSHGSNTSNNSTSAYKADVISFGLGFSY